MTREDEILRLLLESEKPLSGEAMSQQLQISRTAVWKEIVTLRQKGYQIASRHGIGYQLVSSPDRLSAGELTRKSGHIGQEVICLPSVDSTNNECKRQAIASRRDGLVVFADEQTGGKGRLGNSFQSLPGKGLYGSVLLRPERGTLLEISQMTAWTAVAVCRAIEKVTHLHPGIKWTNDILLDSRKVCGILTELTLEGESQAFHSVVIGIGINVHQTEEDFGPKLAKKAVSLDQKTGSFCRRADLAAALLKELDRMYADFPEKKTAYLEEYRARCVTLHKEVRILHPTGEKQATACGINDDFSLQVRYPDGSEAAVTAGEVSVRGLLGYA